MSELINKEQWLDSCKLMLKYYEGKLEGEEFEQVYYYCPLCTVASDIVDYLEERAEVVGDGRVCSYCIWVAFEGMVCDEFSVSKRFETSLEYMRQCDEDDEESLKWWEMRRGMLKEWIKRLEKEIADERK